MTAPPIGSLLVGSDNLQAMKLWYRRAFDVEENAVGAFELGPVQLFLEAHREVAGPAPEPARCILNLDVEDCRALARHLRDLDTRFVRGPDDTDFGVIATVMDPDGNYLQLIQWGAGSAAHVGG